MTEDQVVALFDQLQREMVDRSVEMVRTEFLKAAGGVDLFDDADHALMAASVRAGIRSAIEVLVERGILNLDDL